MKKALRETQTLRAGCGKVEPKKFALPQTPFPGAQDGQNLISRRWSLPSPTDQVWWKSMHAISSYRGNRLTDTARPPQTGPITIHCAAVLLSAQCKNVWRYACSFRHSTSIGWADGQIDRRNCLNNIALCVHCMLTRDKKTNDQLGNCKLVYKTEAEAFTVTVQCIV